jgi:hypothetical protein
MGLRQHLMKTLCNHGVNDVYLTFGPNNIIVIQLYLRLGFGNMDKI